MNSIHHIHRFSKRYSIEDLRYACHGQAVPLVHICGLTTAEYSSRRSIREVGRIMHLSEAKTKRLLIEGRWYSTKETRAVRKLMRNSKTDEETAAELGITTHKVRTLKPYKDSRIYGIGTASAQKSRMYRRRKSEDEHSVVG